MDTDAVDFASSLPPLPDGFELDTGAVPASDDSDTPSDVSPPDTSAPLSVRNNNPGNIRPSTGKGFRTFSTPEEGIQAMQQDLHAKVSGNSSAMKRNFGRNYTPSIRNLISTWAPASDKNNTSAYISDVSGQLGKHPDDVLTPDDVPQLTQAMILHEGGKKAADYFGGTQYAQADTGTQTDATYDNSAPANSLPPLPDGFELDTSSGLPPIPDGFEIDNSSPNSLPGISGIPNMPENAAPAAIAQPDNTPQVPFYGADDKPIKPTKPTSGNPVSSLIANGDVPPPDFIDRMTADWQNRNQQLHEIADANQPLSSTLFQTAGNLGGRGVDAFMNALGSAGRYASFGATNPDNPTGKYNLTDLAHEGMSGLKDSIAPYLNPGVSEAADYIKSNPELARNVSAANDLAMAIPMVKPALGAVGAADAGITGVAKTADEMIPKDSFLGDESSGRTSTPLTPIPSAEDLRARASATYKGLPSGSVALDAEGTNKFLDDIKSIAPQTRVGQLTAGKDSPLSSLLNRWEGDVDSTTGEVTGGIRNTPLTLDEAQEVDEALGDHIDKEIDSTTGRPTKQGLKLMKVQDSFRQAIYDGGTEGGDQSKLARAQWTQAAKMNDLDRITNRALTMDNPATAIRTGMRTLANNPNRFRGYTPQEQALITRASKTGIVPDALRVLGSRLNPIVALGAGSPGGALALQGMSGVSRAGATRWQLARANAAKRAVAEREMPSVRPPVAPPEEATPSAPPTPPAPRQITYQPEFVAGQGDNAQVRPNTPQEQVAAEAGRQRNIDLGITPQRTAAPESSPPLSDANADLATNTFHPTHPDYKNLSYADADAIAQSRPNNYDPENSTPEQKSFDEKMAVKQYGNGAPNKNRRIDIVMGPPGAGKSSALVKPLMDEHGSMLIDSDEIKPNLPGWDHGLGANQVHERSKWITQDMPGSVMEKAENAGDNIVHPVVGKDANRMQDLIDKWHKAGYNVNVHLADVPTEESIKRVIRRFGREGRTVPLSYVQSIGDKPKQVFDKVVKGEKVNDYTHYSTAVPFGEEPKLIRAGTNGIRQDILGQRHDVGSVSGGDGSNNSELSGKTSGEPKAYKAVENTPPPEGSPIKIHAQGKPDTAITPTGDEFDVHHAVVEGKDLIASQNDDMTANSNYPQVLQPRDRSSLASRQQITRLANKLNPRLLMDNPLSSEGAPIISKDGVVESGNGRTLAIRRAYAQNPEGAAQYRQALQKAGYNTRGVKNPVLVRIRQTSMTPEERIKLSQDSNVRTTAGMSSTEQAGKDATRLSAGTLDKFQGGDIKQMRNREFVKSALKDIIPQNEEASVFGKDGELSQEAERRINSALLSKAYDDESISRLLTENTDNELTSLGKALTSAAPAWAQMRESVKNGSVPANMDITPLVTDATKMILRARREGNPLSDYLRTDDMYDPVSAETKIFAKFLHRNEKLTQFKSHDTIADFLTNYARKAQDVQPDVNLFGEKPLKASEVLDAAYKKSLGESHEQTNLFGAKKDTSGGDDDENSGGKQGSKG